MSLSLAVRPCVRVRDTVAELLANGERGAFRAPGAQLSQVRLLTDLDVDGVPEGPRFATRYAPTTIYLMVGGVVYGQRQREPCVARLRHVEFAIDEGASLHSWVPAKISPQALIDG